MMDHKSSDETKVTRHKRRDRIRSPVSVLHPMVLDTRCHPCQLWLRTIWLDTRGPVRSHFVAPSLAAEFPAREGVFRP